jgi:serine/threonine-protein kinase
MSSGIVRLTRGKDLQGSEAVLLILGVGFALLTPVGLAVRHVWKRVWGNTMKAIELAELLRRPVITGLAAYGLASLLVRLIEVVLLRRAVGVAWPQWDVLLFLIGGSAAVVALYLPAIEGKLQKR